MTDYIFDYHTYGFVGCRWAVLKIKKSGVNRIKPILLTYLSREVKTKDFDS